MHRDQPKGGTSPDAVEMRSSGPWPETEINTASGDEATWCLVCTVFLQVDAILTVSTCQNKECLTARTAPLQC